MATTSRTLMVSDTPPEALTPFAQALQVCYHLSPRYLTRLFENELRVFSDGLVGVYFCARGIWQLAFVPGVDFETALRSAVELGLQGMVGGLAEVLGVLMNCPCKELLHDLGLKVPRVMSQVLRQRRDQEHFLVFC